MQTPAMPRRNTIGTLPVACRTALVAGVGWDTITSGFRLIKLRHRFTTLLVFLGTLALTGLMFVVIPKGFRRRRIPA